MMMNPMTSKKRFVDIEIICSRSFSSSLKKTVAASMKPMSEPSAVFFHDLGKHHRQARNNAADTHADSEFFSPDEEYNQKANYDDCSCDTQSYPGLK
jgi:hypothetical protein